MGDLKDRLGIWHRKASKNARVSNLEIAPMFREPHARSASELHLTHVYEPTRMASESDTDEKPPIGYTELIPEWGCWSETVEGGVADRVSLQTIIIFSTGGV